MQNDPASVKDQQSPASDRPHDVSARKATPSADPGAAYMQQKYISPQLDAALNKRYDDFRDTYRDLVVRLTETAARTQSDLNTVKGYTSSLQATLDGLKSIASRLGGETPPEFDYRDQSRLAQEFRNIEHLRLEAFRLIASAEANRTRRGSDGKDSQTAGSSLDLLSLTFSQLCRMGFAFALPLLLVIFFSTLLLAAALICAFNGSLVW